MRPRKIDSTEIVSIIENPQTVVVDSRSWEEFREGHARRALFVPPTCSIADIAEAYLVPGQELCLIARENELDFMVEQLTFGGVRRVDVYITPEDLQLYFDNGGEKAVVDEIWMADMETSLTKNDMQLIDLRRPEELEDTGQVASAINIPHLLLGDQITRVAKEMEIYLYCRTGQRSKYATAYLMHHGYRVTHLAGGIFDWLEAGKPVVPFTGDHQ